MSERHSHPGRPPALQQEAQQLGDTTIDLHLKGMIALEVVSNGQAIFRLVARNAACFPEQLCCKDFLPLKAQGTADDWPPVRPSRAI
ncbi:MAG: hypothetical protein CM15mP77_0780 [Synechococcus sp.]|nr:MAG: hypothetical protein CM15mP77_0780 [Synechococcus sp.]